jgi:cytosine/adenosine deaminase-related metal-dependent hydrolase
VVVAGGIIAAVDPFPELRRRFPTAAVTEHCPGALLPALVNAHTHLDLSSLAGRVQVQGGMAAWIRALLAARARLSPAERGDSAEKALVTLRALGTGIVADIESSVGFVEAADGSVPFRRSFLEVLGLHTKRLSAALGSLPAAARQALRDRPDVSLAAHAPYSVSAVLLKGVKRWGTTQGKVVSIHAAESEEEILFLHTGRGPLRDLLEERGMEPGLWEPPECGAVSYLDRLGFLDPLSLCVHVVKLGSEEIQLLRRSGAGVCLCPRSNLFLGHGLPEVARLLEAGIPCALGTDSLASNDDLNLFEEMAVLVDRCGIPAGAVLAMATLHGARNLGLGAHYGSLEAGKRWLAIRVAGSSEEDIIGAGCRGVVEWAA